MSRPPREDWTWRLVRLLRPASVALLGGALLAVVVYFAFHFRRAPGPPPIAKNLTEEKVEVQEKAQHFRYQGEHFTLEFEADRRELRDDGLYHLEGDVHLSDRGRKGGRDIRMKAARAIHDKDMVRAVLSGGVEITSRGLTLASSEFIYNKATDEARSEGPGEFRAERLTGSARRVGYRLSEERMELEGDVVLTFQPRDADPAPLRLTAGRMSLHYAGRRGRLSGGVRMVRGASSASAEAAEFQLFDDRDDLHILWLMGGARIKARPSPADAEARARAKARREREKAMGGADSYQALFFFDSDWQDVAADQVMMTVYPQAPLIRFVRAAGDADILVGSESGQRLRIRGDMVVFDFHWDRRLRSLDVRSLARIHAVSPEVPGGRTIDADLLMLDGFERVLKVHGEPPRLCHSKAEDRDVTAGKMVFYLQVNAMDAWESVSAVLTEPEATAAGEGLFAAGRPVFAWCRFLRFTQRTSNLSLIDNVRLGQEKKVLEGGEITLNKATRSMTGTRGVKFAFPHTPKSGGPEERIEIRAQRLDYDPETRQTVFTGQAALATRDVDLRSSTITVVPGAEAGSARSIRASGAVRIRQGEREASGREADYDVAAETIVLTGSPVLVDKNKGTMRGDKLTFHLADGNILVENRGQERASAVIKS